MAYQQGLISGLLFEKMDSGSTENRSIANMQAWYSFIDSYGLGLGFGSFRASSLFATILVCGGIPVFCVALYLLFSAGIRLFSCKKNYASCLIGGAFFSYLIVAGASLPDANTPILWLLMAFYLHAIHAPDEVDVRVPKAPILARPHFISRR